MANQEDTSLLMTGKNEKKNDNQFERFPCATSPAFILACFSRAYLPICVGSCPLKQKPSTSCLQRSRWLLVGSGRPGLQGLGNYSHISAEDTETISIGCAKKAQWMPWRRLLQLQAGIANMAKTANSSKLWSIPWRQPFPVAPAAGLLEDSDTS